MGPDVGHTGARNQSSLHEVAASRYSRRQVLRRSAIALGGVAGLGLLDPSLVFGSAKSAAPQPIPGGFSFTANDFVASGADLHFFLPGIGAEMSTITDFNGVVGGSETRGSARGTDGSTWDFDCDMRFMQGVYIGLDGRVHNGSFGFI
jgi:hypothetical protein